MDRATRRYREAMIAPKSRGICRYCEHNVDGIHVQVSNPEAPVWCAGCHAAGTVCGAAKLLGVRQAERETARVTR